MDSQTLNNNQDKEQKDEEYVYNSLKEIDTNFMNLCNSIQSTKYKYMYYDIHKMMDQISSFKNETLLGKKENEEVQQEIKKLFDDIKNGTYQFSKKDTHFEIDPILQNELSKIYQSRIDEDNNKLLLTKVLKNKLCDDDFIQSLLDDIVKDKNYFSKILTLNKSSAWIVEIKSNSGEHLDHFMNLALLNSEFKDSSWISHPIINNIYINNKNNGFAYAQKESIRKMELKLQSNEKIESYKIYYISNSGYDEHKVGKFDYELWTKEYISILENNKQQLEQYNKNKLKGEFLEHNKDLYQYKRNCVDQFENKLKIFCLRNNILYETKNFNKIPSREFKDKYGEVVYVAIQPKNNPQMHNSFVDFMKQLDINFENCDLLGKNIFVSNNEKCLNLTLENLSNIYTNFGFYLMIYKDNNLKLLLDDI